jgi:hypothetical protein
MGECVVVAESAWGRGGFLSDVQHDVHQEVAAVM